MGISVNTSNQQITASVGETKIDVSVGGGVGPTGPTGPQGSLVMASVSTLGGVRIGSGVSIDVNGVISVSTSYAASSHAHGFLSSSGTLTSGAVGAAFVVAPAVVTSSGFLRQGEFGTGSGTICQGNDARLSDQRTPSDNSVTSVKIATGAVTAQKIASSAVNNTHIDTTFPFSFLSVNGVSYVQGGSIYAIGGTLESFTAQGSTVFRVTSGGIVDVGAWQATPVAVAYGGTGATTAADARANLGIVDGGGKIPVAFLPVATANAIGAVRIGSGVSIDGDGIISVSTSYAAASHTHAASAINSGTLDIARIPTGTSATTVCIGNDARLSDARTPLSHTHAPADVSFAATDRLLGRSSAGAGAGQEIVCTAAGRALLDDADAAAQRSTLSAQKTITSGTAAPTGGSDGDIYLQYTA